MKNTVHITESAPDPVRADGTSDKRVHGSPRGAEFVQRDGAALVRLVLVGGEYLSSTPVQKVPTGPELMMSSFTCTRNQNGKFQYV